MHSQGAPGPTVTVKKWEGSKQVQFKCTLYRLAWNNIRSAKQNGAMQASARGSRKG